MTLSSIRQMAVLAVALFAPATLAAIVMYLAGRQFLVLNEADPAEAGITSIIDYWAQYADDPEQRERLWVAILTPVGHLLLLLVVAVAAKFVPWRRLRMAARFALAPEIKRADVFSRGGEPRIFVGRYKSRYLALGGHDSVLLFAPPHSGKEGGMVIPNLLTWSNSVVVLDIDGGNFDVTAGFRASLGPLFAFSPFDDRARSHCWNPLSAVRDTDEHRQADLQAIAQALFPTAAGQESSEVFYRTQARKIFVQLGLTLFDEPELPRTLGEMLRQASQPGRLLIDVARRALENGDPLYEEITSIVRRELRKPKGVLDHLISTFTDGLSIFGETSVDASTSGNDFRLEDVRRMGMSIYIRIRRSRLDSAKPLLNLFFSQLVALNTRVSPAQDPALKYKCLLLNDEFLSMGRVGSIVSKATVFGDYNLRLLTIIEEMSELDAVYGRQAARRFASAHAARNFYAPLLRGDFDAHSTPVDHCGRGTVSRGWIRSASCHLSAFLFDYPPGYQRPLLRAKEFNLLDHERLVFIAPGGTPVLGHKIRYESDAVLKARYRKPPVVPRLDIKRHMVLVQRRVMYTPDPVKKPTPAGRNADAGLARDLGGLAGRLEISLGKPADQTPGRRDASDQEQAIGMDCVGVAGGGEITPLVEPPGAA